MKYNNWTLGQVEAVFNKLGGDEGVRLFLAGGLVVKPADCNLPVWKTIRLGTGIKDADAFRQAIKAKGMKVGDWANDILGKSAFTTAAEETELDLVVVSVKDLGFSQGATREQIYTRAKELGLQLCPNEVGPQLRLQYADQPKGEWLIVAMEPITDSGGDLRLFYVGHDGYGQWLGGYCGGPDFVWGAGPRFLFGRPRK